MTDQQWSYSAQRDGSRAPMSPVRRALLAWAVAVLGLAAMATGAFGIASGTTTFSMVRMGVAAAVLSLYACAVALLAVPRGERSLLRNLVFAGTVPLLMAVGTVIAVMGTEATASSAVLAGLWWLPGLFAAPLLGRIVPGLRLPWHRD